MLKLKYLAIALPALALCLGASTADAQMKARADLFNSKGVPLGIVDLVQTPNGVLLSAKFNKMPAGTHAFHVHAVGKCELQFKSAGGHYNPRNRKHGILTAGGIHAGDMPNVHVPASGSLTIEVLNPNITLEKGKDNTVFDADGSAIVLHAKGDDYKSQPSGAAGGRIACGVIK
jgi:Cu-Zn family superoxide dismutase